MTKMSTESRARQTAKAAPPKAPPAKAKSALAKTSRTPAPAAKPAPAKASLAKSALTKAAKTVPEAVAAGGVAARASAKTNAPKTTAARPAPQVPPAKAAIAAKVSPAKAVTKSVTASVPKAAKTVSVKAAMSVKSSASKSSASVKAAEIEVAADTEMAAEKPFKAPKAAAAKTAVVQAVAVQAVAVQAVAVQAPATAKVVALKPAEKEVFQPDDYVVYPTHGVGRILKIEKQEISGISLELFVIEFEKDKMTLRVPLAKVRQVGMRRLSTPQKMKAALDTLKGRARVKRTMWSRRAQEYEAKINSGDPVSIAEVVRDLHRNAGQPDQSYSERQIYEAALDRLARELAAVERIDEDAATKRLEKLMKAA